MSIQSLFAKYCQQGILVDTNILLLWFVGQVNRRRISTFKRTQKYNPEDYSLLLNILDGFQQVVTTPHILTEVNSLINQIQEPERSRCMALFELFLASQPEHLPKMEEFYTKSLTLTASPAFQRFGLADSSILDLAQGKYLVLTDDLKLFVHLQSHGVDAINFTHLRNLP